MAPAISPSVIVQKNSHGDALARAGGVVRGAMISGREQRPQRGNACGFRDAAFLTPQCGQVTFFANMAGEG